MSLQKDSLPSNCYLGYNLSIRDHYFSKNVQHNIHVDQQFFKLKLCFVWEQLIIDCNSERYNNDCGKHPTSQLQLLKWLWRMKSRLNGTTVMIAIAMYTFKLFSRSKNHWTNVVQMIK